MLTCWAQGTVDESDPTAAAAAAAATNGRVVGARGPGSKHPVTRFLNRLLGLDLSSQRALLDWFLEGCLAQVVDDAKAEGLFFDGIRTERAEEVRVASRKQLTRVEEGAEGAEATKVLTLECTDRITWQGLLPALGTRPFPGGAAAGSPELARSVCRERALGMHQRREAKEVEMEQALRRRNPNLQLQPSYTGFYKSNLRVEVALVLDYKAREDAQHGTPRIRAGRIRFVCMFGAGLCPGDHALQARGLYLELRQAASRVQQAAAADARGPRADRDRLAPRPPPCRSEGLHPVELCALGGPVPPPRRAGLPHALSVHPGARAGREQAAQRCRGRKVCRTEQGEEARGGSCPADRRGPGEGRILGASPCSALDGLFVPHRRCWLGSGYP